VLDLRWASLSSRQGTVVDQTNTECFICLRDDFLPLVTGWVCCINSNDATNGGIQVWNQKTAPSIIVDKVVAGLEFPNQLHTLGSGVVVKSL